MTNSFLRVANNAHIENFTSQGLDVYINAAKTNLNIFELEVFNSTGPPSGNMVDGLPLDLHNTDARGY